VRLKESEFALYGAEIQISIPFGAIKSEQYEYLMTTKEDFNSFWCD